LSWSPEASGKAIVCFYDPAGARLPWLLKRGFRHCFACVRDGDYWILVDGAAGVPQVKLLAQADFDLAQFYRTEGYTVVETAQRAQPIRCPFSVANCVGLVKAVLAIRAPFAITPHQLYRHLLKEQRA
jgi:hypothetical protein